jgi:hypothetical protein
MNSDITKSLIVAGSLIGVGLAATVARQQGLIDSETVQRLTMGAIGLMVVWYGNRAPKAFVPSALGRRITRFTGWSMTLSGLVYAGTWAFAPLPVAMTIGTGAVAISLIASVAYCLWLRGQARGGAPTTS